METSSESGRESWKAVVAQLQEPQNPLRPAALAQLLQSQWDTDQVLPAVSECLQDSSAMTRELAVLVLEKAGAPALDALIQATDTQQPLPVRIAAAAALGRLGGSAAPAVASLSRCVLSEQILLRDTAALALGFIGAAAVPALSALLQSDDDPIKMAALSALGRIGPPARAVIADLKNLCTAAGPALQPAACAALIKISGDPAEALPMLLEGLQHPDETVRKESIEHLGLLQTLARPTLSPLLPCLQDPAPAVRAACALALVRIDPQGTQITDALLPLLQDAEPEPRINAAIALGTIGPAAAAAVPGLTQMQNDADPKLAAIAGAALQRIVPRESG
jgi:HEAT repeat protein